MHALTAFRSPVWLLLHKLSSPHYRYIRKMRRGDRLPLTQTMHSSIQENFSGTPASNRRELRLHLYVVPTAAGVFKGRHILLHKYVNRIMITFL